MGMESSWSCLEGKLNVRMRFDPLIKGLLSRDVTLLRMMRKL